MAIDYGLKHNILRHLVEAGFGVTRVPATLDAAGIRALRPDGIFLSNGPGDPAPVTYGVDTVRDLSIAEGEKDQILGGNAQRLLKIEQRVPVSDGIVS